MVMSCSGWSLCADCGVVQVIASLSRRLVAGTPARTLTPLQRLLRVRLPSCALAVGK